MGLNKGMKLRKSGGHKKVSQTKTPMHELVRAQGIDQFEQA